LNFRSLGRTGVRVSEMCLGTMNFGGRTGESDARQILDVAREAGVNLIDTANVYGHDPADLQSWSGA
jgi:NDP-hexose C3-ketoreductase / dTDP-4-oxo-2-deoxy-alpha-D-pentos-2-ene 2,3-reductase